jgi:hypothetical protein
MIQAGGIALILFGALMFHVAASNSGASNITDVWNDMLKTISGETIAQGTDGSGGTKIEAN